MNKLKVLDSYVSGKTVHIQAMQEDAHCFDIFRVELGHEKYTFYLEQENGDINITGLVSQELKSKISTIAHEYRMKKTLNK